MIKTLLFDFGDVFLNLDKKATLSNLQQLGLEDFSAEMIGHNQQYEVGKITSQEFIGFYEKQLPQAGSESLTNSWNSILMDLPQHRLEFLQQLKNDGKYQLILLSNTNDLHIEWVKNNIETFKDFKACFDAFYLSHEIGLRKPDAEIYEFVLNKHNLKPEELFFVDDTKENTDAAKQLGIHVWNIQPEEDVSDLFKKHSHLF